MLAGLLAARDLSAQDITETWNNTYGSWNDPNNWAPAGVPNNGGGTNYIAAVGSGGPVLGNDVLLDGLNYNGGDISGSYNLTVLGDFNVSGADRVLGNQLADLGSRFAVAMDFGKFFHLGNDANPQLRDFPPCLPPVI